MTYLCVSRDPSPIRLLPALLGGWLLLGACVTVNIYFPAAAAEKAADTIIRDVWGRTSPSPQREGAEPGASGTHHHAHRALVALSWLVPPVQAQQANIDISTPAIQSLRASMRTRHAQLKAYYDSGAIGLTPNALLDVRDLGAVPLPSRNALRKLVADENRDRDALYREIAVANGHPEWEAQIRATFARQWVDNASSGWWYGGPGGWAQK
jgi:uncharacterized protein YdbL (DUF1318 family)